MAVTHCHDDKQCLILDQRLYLTDAYAHTKDARIRSESDTFTNFTWLNQLFNVTQPFRATHQTSKEKKKQKKRKHDEAFDQTSTDFLKSAVEFCRTRLSFNESSTAADVQQEYHFDQIPFADIATQQNDRLPTIRQILLTDYFLRASKLGIQPNILYTHDKPHPSIVDTAIAGEIILPANCRFLWSDMKNLQILVSEGTKYSFIVLDPPWMNKSVRRKRPYQWSDFDQIRSLPVEHLIDQQRSTLICCWSTNCDRVEEFIKNDLFSKWKCHYLTTWYWLKITRRGEPVLDIDSIDKKTYETLILAYAGDENRFVSLKNSSKIICSVPALIHSVKPVLHRLFQNLIEFPQENDDRCLEIYARNLLANFTSVGNEVLKHQSIDLFERI